MQQIKRKNDGKGKYKLKYSASCGRFQDAFPIPWFHHQRIIDKCKDDMDKALFFVRKTWENNWGRDALLNWLDTDLYERDGKAITLFLVLQISNPIVGLSVGFFFI